MDFIVFECSCGKAHTRMGQSICRFALTLLPGPEQSRHPSSSFFSVRALGELLYVLSHSMPCPVLEGRHSHLHLQTRKQPLTSYLTSTIANKSLAPEPVPLFLLPQDSAFLEIAFTESAPLTQLLRVL